MSSKAEIVKELENFQQLLYNWEDTYNARIRSAINKKIPFVQKILRLTGTSKTLTIAPPPMVGGLMMKDVDPFTCIYEPPYGLSVVGLISDCIDEAIGVIEADDSFLSKIHSTVKPSQKKENKAIAKISEKVFIVHGRDNETKETVARFVEKLGLTPIILHEQPNGGKTIIEKFETFSDVGFAIILLTPDDKGYLASESDTIKSRARQNVIFEQGYFIGKLGRERVVALVRGDIELPSDVSGIMYVDIDGRGAWKLYLAKEMKNAGYAIDLNLLA